MFRSSLFASTLFAYKSNISFNTNSPHHVSIHVLISVNAQRRNRDENHPYSRKPMKSELQGAETGIRYRERNHLNEITCS